MAIQNDVLHLSALLRRRATRCRFVVRLLLAAAIIGTGLLQAQAFHVVAKFPSQSSAWYPTPQGLFSINYDHRNLTALQYDWQGKVRCRIAAFSETPTTSYYIEDEGLYTSCSPDGHIFAAMAQEHTDDALAIRLRVWRDGKPITDVALTEADWQIPFDPYGISSLQALDSGDLLIGSQGKRDYSSTAPQPVSMQFFLLRGDRYIARGTYTSATMTFPKKDYVSGDFQPSGALFMLTSHTHPSFTEFNTLTVQDGHITVHPGPTIPGPDYSWKFGSFLVGADNSVYDAQGPVFPAGDWQYFTDSSGLSDTSFLAQAKDSTCRVMDLQTRTVAWSCTAKHQIASAAVSTDGNYLAVMEVADISSTKQWLVRRLPFVCGRFIARQHGQVTLTIYQRPGKKVAQTSVPCSLYIAYHPRRLEMRLPQILAISPDGHTVAIDNDRVTLRRW